jgi:hypothetical protein
MRQFVSLFLFSLLVAPELANGHGGGLNAEGGHYNRKTGEYHCHREPCFSNQQQQLKQWTPVAAPGFGVLSTNSTCKLLHHFKSQHVIL